MVQSNAAMVLDLKMFETADDGWTMSDFTKGAQRLMKANKRA